MIFFPHWDSESLSEKLQILPISDLMQALTYVLSVQAAPPCLQDNTADLDRLLKHIRSQVKDITVTVPYPWLARVAARFRDANFRGAAILNNLDHELELVDFLPAAPLVLPALALDLGTTWLEAQLIDLMTGDVLATEGRENTQITHGADILARIHAASDDSGLTAMHRAAIDDVNHLAGILAKKADIEPSAIRALCIAGNTTMTHFFLRLPPLNICREPYIPVVNAPDIIHATDLGLAIDPAAPVFVFPSVGSYFGGDLIAGIVATGLARDEHPAMLMDVGTNAEVVVGCRDWLLACAGAAGPALEGGVAKMGMRAGDGAVERIRIDSTTGAVCCRTIGNGLPQGICGSGLIDLMAELYLAGLVDFRGRFRAKPGDKRFMAGKDGMAFVVADSTLTCGTPVVVSQVDLDSLIRSKAAMYTILSTIVREAGIDFQDINRIYVAGSFGRHIDPDKAITIGMIPDLPRSTYTAIGNSSLAGAAKALISRDARQEARTIGKRITYIELNVNQEFMLRFSGAKCLPHTDRSLFPSVPPGIGMA